MEEIIVNKEEIEKHGIEITSVSSFIDEINRLKDELHGSNQELYFRGQKTDFWQVMPSIFRDDFLSVEHALMQMPLLKAPHEFISINNDFEIMTKYQHYGMCTRLLDLTTNPLVALYFACEKYGDVCYVEVDGKEEKEEKEEKEANGVIFFNKQYAVSANELKIKIISALSQIELSKDNTLESILKQLVKKHVIAKDDEEKWKSEEYYKEFIEIIQSNYIVIPPYSNERLSRQCGIFLLAGCFNFVYTESIINSYIEKGYKDLRDEFDDTFYYVPGEKKKAILDELDTYNINEATLFPELEHQLSYIKNKKNTESKITLEFEKFDSTNIETKIVRTDTEISDEVIKKENFKDSVIKDLSEKYHFDIQKIWELIEVWVSAVDWNKQEFVIGRFRFGVQKELMKNGFNKEAAEKESNYIRDTVIEIASELSKGSEQ